MSLLSRLKKTTGVLNEEFDELADRRDYLRRKFFKKARKNLEKIYFEELTFVCTEEKEKREKANIIENVQEKEKQNIPENTPKNEEEKVIK